MQTFPGIPDDERGLRPKYRAFKIDDQNGHHSGHPIKVKGFPVTEVDGDFFLLKFDDPFAKAALLAYADACQGKHPTLAADIRRKLDKEYEARTLQRLHKEIRESEENVMMQREKNFGIPRG